LLCWFKFEILHGQTVNAAELFKYYAEESLPQYRGNIQYLALLRERLANARTGLELPHGGYVTN
jgi:hypothetical protein